MEKVTNYKLVVDSVADLDPLWLELHPEVVVIPLGITDEHTTRFDNSVDRIKDLIYAKDTSVGHSYFTEVFRDRFESTDTFYEYLAAQYAKGIFLGTSYVQRMADEIFSQLFEEGTPFLYVGMTCELSSTYYNNVFKIEELGEIFKEVKYAYVESRCIAPGYRLLIERLVARNLDFDEAIAFVEAERDKIVHLFTINSFEQVVAGGRVSATEAFFGRTLSIRPYMRFDYTQNDRKGPDEPAIRKHLSVTGRTRTDRKLYERMISEIIARIASPKQCAKDPTACKIIVSHAYASERADHFTELLRERLRDCDLLDYYEIVSGRVGPVIGVHVGGTTLAVFFTAHEPSTLESPTWRQYNNGR